MKFDPARHHRRSIRLNGYDYSQPGAYFVTICTHNRECMFGEIVDGEMRLNDLGHIIAEEWSHSPEIRKEIELPEWIVMPNHLHGIVVIKNRVGADGDTPRADSRPPLQRKPRSLGSFIAGFRSSATKRINLLRDTPGMHIWHRNYYEHIIRNEREWNAIAEYIRNNPLRWSLDVDNPAKPSRRLPLESVEDYWIDAGLNV